jgi:hypothetical protein
VRSAIAGLALLVTACAPPAEERRREAQAAEAVIAPGRYTNMALAPEADPQGVMLDLPQGSASRTANVVVFYARHGGPAARTQGVAVRRGLSGVFFDAPYASGRAATTFAVQPRPNDTVLVTWRDDMGLQTAVLLKVDIATLSD